MAKWFGKIGYNVGTYEASPGVRKEKIEERPYYGEVIRNTRRLQTLDKVNDNITVSNQISILADPYASKNFHMIRYIIFMNNKWKVTNVEVQYPRLILDLGEVYNAH